MESPNERLTPIYNGEEIEFVPLSEYYRRILGHIASGEDDGEA